MSEDLSHLSGGTAFEFERIQRDEEAARLRYEAQREQNLMNEGRVAPQDHDLLSRLEAEWKAALERLHVARQERGN